MRTNLLLVGSAIVLSTIFIALVPAAAETIIVTENAEPRAAVSVADLNLNSTTGVASLQRRIEGAAAELCLTTAVEPIDTRLARAKCYRAAVSSGQRQIERMMAAQPTNSTASAALILTATATGR